MIEQAAIRFDGRALAEDLYHLIQTLDPVAWRPEFEAAAREKVQRIRVMLEAFMAHDDGDDGKPSAELRSRLQILQATIEEFCADGRARFAEGRAECRRFFRKLQPCYEAVRSSLDDSKAAPPALRQTNHRRIFFHVGSGLICLAIIQYLLPPEQLKWVAGAFLVAAWSMEGGRRLSARFNRLLMKFFGPVAHPHEHNSVNSASWYTTALFLVALTSNQLAASMAVIVLALADPAAGLVGRRWGSIKLVGNRSLQGSLTFFVVGGLAAMAVLALYHPEISLGFGCLIALSAGLLGALAELFSQRLDDNLAIPVIVGLGVHLVVWLPPQLI